MRVWRICRARFGEQAFTGEGARLYGGRWNAPGVRVVYTSTSLALAAVELFVNLDPSLAPSDLVSIAADLPDSLKYERLEIAQLPPDWRRTQHEGLRSLGGAWITRASSVALLVPSAAIAGEWNVLLNPAHPDFARLKIEAPVPFSFDPRMFR